MTCECGCNSGQFHFAANLSGVTRRETYKGAVHLVAPVSMLRAIVVNKALIPKGELLSEPWNGTPVVLNHPKSGNKFISANSPSVLEECQIGFVFNSKVKGDKLTGEVWINVECAEKVYPGLVSQIESGGQIEVSTAYYHNTGKSSGTFNGKAYNQIHTELKPDHLAILPEDVGACSWEDGCGIRANKRNGKMSDDQDETKGFMKFLKMLSSPAANARGESDNRGQIVADLISSNDSPFLPDQMYLLMELPGETLTDLRDKYLTNDPATNEEKGAPDMADENKNGAGAPSTNRVSDMSIEDFTALMTQTATAAAEAAVAKSLTTNRQSELVAELAANKALGLDEDDLKGLPLATLEKMAANSAKPKAKEAPKTGVNFAGRAVTANADDGTNVTKYPGMVGAPAAAAKE